MAMSPGERIARAFHDEYEAHAPLVGWVSQSPVPFEQLPEANRTLMLTTVLALLDKGVIKPGDD